MSAASPPLTTSAPICKSLSTCLAGNYALSLPHAGIPSPKVGGCEKLHLSLYCIDGTIAPIRVTHSRSYPLPHRRARCNSVLRGIKKKFFRLLIFLDSFERAYNAEL